MKCVAINISLNHRTPRCHAAITLDRETQGLAHQTQIHPAQQSWLELPQPLLLQCGQCRMKECVPSITGDPHTSGALFCDLTFVWTGVPPPG
jgi:hypothetical protein